MNTSQRTASIMIVDDEPANLKLLGDVLRQKGYSVRSFPRGRMALAAAAENPPDLILLDVNMPEMSGYEVCEQLKADPGLSEIPVVFLSALHETEDKVKGFQSGGVDFISKPFQFEEVYARVETQLKVHDLQRSLKVQNEHLEEVVDLRTRELAEANARLMVLDRAKDDFLKVISHELRTPLNGLLGVSEIALDEPFPTDENIELRQMFEQSRQRLVSILDDALLLTQIDVQCERFRSAPVSLCVALSRAIEGTVELANSRQVTIEPPASHLGLVLGDEDLLTRALQALLETAVRFSPEGGTVHLAQETLPDSLSLMIRSYGRSIPLDAMERFFDIFSIGDAITPGGELGLGPPVASRILSLYGGTVTVANHEPAGIRLTVDLQRTAL